MVVYINQHFLGTILINTLYIIISVKQNINVTFSLFFPINKNNRSYCKKKKSRSYRILYDYFYKKNQLFDWKEELNYK